ncbi:hypothetical protein STENM36S_09379 [Streptomyces tendae]
MSVRLVITDAMWDRIKPLMPADPVRGRWARTQTREQLLSLPVNKANPGQLIVIAGRPTTGTSTLALNLLRSAAVKHNLPAAYFALESRRTDITMRLLVAEARVALHHMRSGTMTDDDWSRLAKGMPSVSGAPLYLQDDAYANFTKMRAHCRRLHGLKLIAVDDLQLLNYGTRPLGSRCQKVSEVARSLKNLAKELEIPVIAVSTLNAGPNTVRTRGPTSATCAIPAPWRTTPTSSRCRPQNWRTCPSWLDTEARGCSRSVRRYPAMGLELSHRRHGPPARRRRQSLRVNGPGTCPGPRPGRRPGGGPVRG